MNRHGDCADCSPMQAKQVFEDSLVHGVVESLSNAGIPEKSLNSYQVFLEADYSQVKKLGSEMDLLAGGISYLEGASEEIPSDPEVYSSIASWAFVQCRSVSAKTHQEFHGETHQAMVEAMSGDTGTLLLEESVEELGHQFDEASVWLEDKTGETLFTQALGGFSQIFSDNVERSQDASGVPDGVVIVDEAAVEWISENGQDLVDYVKAVKLLFPVDEEDDTSPELQEAFDAFIEDLG